MRIFRTAKLFCIFYLLFLTGRTQSIDIPLNEFTFHSAFEKEAFQQVVIHNDKGIFKGFLAGDSVTDNQDYNLHKRLFQQTIQSLNTEKFTRYSAKKKVKVLYKTLHSTFLGKYEMKNTFSILFKKGIYNCVSATALYAMAMQEIGIPYSIHETPTHVYIIAYPNAEQILIETTDPAGGYYVFDDKFKSGFISYMRKMKLISEQEYENQSVQSLFDKYYFSDESIGLVELLALQYYNDALYNLEEERYVYAAQQLEKAYQLYPSKRINYMLKSATAMTLSKMQLSDHKYIDYLIKYYKYADTEEDNDIVTNEFTRFTLEHLSNKFNIDYSDSMYIKFQEHLKDSSMSSSIAHLYHQEKGRILYNKGQYNQALPSIETAYQLQPQNANNQLLLTSVLAQKVQTITNNTDKIEMLQDYIRKYPTIADNSLLNANLIQLYLLQFARAYDLNNEKEASYYRNLFEGRMLNKSQNVAVNIELIGRAYSLAAVYYFKKGNDKQTKAMLNKGLEYAPDNYELLQRKKMLSY